jgi:hypothetical protein
MKKLDDFCDLDKPGWGYPEKLSERQAKALLP